MRLLADESCDYAVVRALREAGFDVAAVGGVFEGTEDNVVIDLAVREGRTLITEDKDLDNSYMPRERSSGRSVVVVSGKRPRDNGNIDRGTVKTW